MNFRFLALALLATMAGVASTHAFKPIGALRSSSDQSQPLSLAVPPKIPAPPVRNALVSDATRLPVPLLLAPRRPVVSAAEAASDSLPVDTDASPPVKMTEAAAKAAIEADGYKGVRALSRGLDGVWKASALRGQTEVRLSVNSTGDVSTN